METTHTIQKQITFDGTTPDGGPPVARVVIWYDYRDWKRRPPRRSLRQRIRRRFARPEAPGVVGYARHGEKGRLLEYNHPHVRVRTKRGDEGWTSFWFIKELKGNWMRSQGFDWDAYV